MPSVKPVVLSGGSGTRLWPLSTPELPKQFAPLMEASSLFESTLRRVAAVPGVEEIVVSVSADHLGLVAGAVEASGLPTTFVLEPVGRNTAPAAVAAALLSDPDDVLLVVPSDHVIENIPEFITSVEAAVELSQEGKIVTLGVVPSRPDTGFGYIEKGEPTGPGFELAAFVEKPPAETAQSFVDGGRHLWNAGMFVSRADVFLAEMQTHRPGLVDAVRLSLPESSDGVARMSDLFADVESVSIDYAVMEKTDRGAVVPLDAGWSDLGSFESLYEIAEKDEDGNVLEGDVVTTSVKGSLVKATSRRITVLGVNDIIVIETPEEVLVVPLSRAQDIRDLKSTVRPD